MDPWNPKAQAGRYTRRRIPRVTLPRNSSARQIELFERQLEDARTFAREMGVELFRYPDRVDNPSNFILSRVEKQLPRHIGRRLAIAAVILHQALLQVEQAISETWQGSSWTEKGRLQERRKAIRAPLQTMAQNLLTQAWARIPRDLRQIVFEAFKNPEGEIDEIWRRICRGSLSAAFVVRAFHGIQTTARKRTEKCRACKTSCLHSSTEVGESSVCEQGRTGSCFEDTETSSPNIETTCLVGEKREKTVTVKRWQVYCPTDREDRWGKIDLIVTGRLAGLGRIGLCIQVKTGEESYLEVMTQEPSDLRGPSREREEIRDRLWDGTEDFKARHPEIARSKVRFYPAIVQTGRATAPVTMVADNTKSVRALIESMLATLETDLKDKRRRERIYREIDRPGPKPRKPRKPKT